MLCLLFTRSELPMNRLIVSVAALVIAATSSADAEGYFMMGAGAQTCAVLIKRQSQSSEPILPTWFAWAQGYMSGINRSANSGTFRDMSAIPLPDQKRAIRDYCAENPQANFRDGVAALFAKMPIIKPSGGLQKNGRHQPHRTPQGQRPVSSTGHLPAR
jgi:hypothetical protein